MALIDYAFYVAVVLLLIMGSAFPLLMAIAVAWWPGQRPQYKRAFVITAALIAYGAASLIGLLAVPFELFREFMSAQMESDGYRTLPQVMAWLLTATTWLTYAATALAAIAVPLVMRKRMWVRMCEVMTSRPQNEATQDPAR